MAAHEPCPDDCADDRRDEDGDADRASVGLDRLAEPVAAHAEDRRPDDSARGVEEEEPLPVEVVDAGEESLGELVVASGDGPEMFELVEETLNEIAFAVEGEVAGAWGFFGWIWMG